MYYPRLARYVVTEHVLDVDIPNNSFSTIMSAPPHSIEDIIPFIFYNTPNDSSVGTNALLDGSGNIDYQLPPYRLTDADVVPTPGRPLLTVSPSERGPSRVQVEGDSWPPFHFFSHPAIYRLMPFVRIPARIRRTDPLYLATILDRAVPVFVSPLFNIFDLKAPCLTIRDYSGDHPALLCVHPALPSPNGRPSGPPQTSFRGFPNRARACPERLDGLPSR